MSARCTSVSTSWASRGRRRCRCWPARGRSGPRSGRAARWRPAAAWRRGPPRRRRRRARAGRRIVAAEARHHVGPETAASRRGRMSRSSRSPAAWPSVSLSSLKWSRSMSSRASWTSPAGPAPAPRRDGRTACADWRARSAGRGWRRARARPPAPQLALEGVALGRVAHVEHEAPTLASCRRLDATTSKLRWLPSPWRRRSESRATRPGCPAASSR